MRPPPAGEKCTKRSDSPPSPFLEGLSRFAEKTWIRFGPAALGRAAPLVGAIGLIPLGCMLRWLGGPLHAWLGPHWGHFATKFVFVFFCIAVYPAVIKGVGRLARKS